MRFELTTKTERDVRADFVSHACYNKTSSSTTEGNGGLSISSTCMRRHCLVFPLPKTREVMSCSPEILPFGYYLIHYSHSWIIR